MNYQQIKDALDKLEVPKWIGEARKHINEQGTVRPDHAAKMLRSPPKDVVEMFEGMVRDQESITRRT